ncbi:MAG: glycosyltransferase family 2 protein [Candidatus Curtissbacteria bacterium]
MDLAIIVPALNEDQVIASVLSSLPKKIKGISKIHTLVINDGSTDNTAREAKGADAIVLTHVVNRGLGAAIKTGLSWAKKEDIDIVVTFDSDGQHNPLDIPRMIEPIRSAKADVVIGSRFMAKQKIPKDRLFLNQAANLVALLLFGVRSTDTQSGLRAFSRKAIELIDYKADRMEFSSEIFLEAKRNNLKVVEIPISAIYTPYSRGKGQKNTNAIPITIRFLVKFLR